MGKQAGQGSSSQSNRRQINPQQQPIFDLVNRGLLGQMAEPPETPISVPLQQAITNAQGGMPYLRSQFGLGGGLANRLTGEGVGGGQMLPGPTQSGLQTREQLGLPPRKEQMGPWIPSAEELEALGSVPKVRPSGKSGRRMQRLEKREERLQDRIATRSAAGKTTGKAETRLAGTQDKLSDVRERMR